MHKRTSFPCSGHSSQTEKSKISADSETPPSGGKTGQNEPPYLIPHRGWGGQIPRRPPPPRRAPTLPLATPQRHRRSFCRQRCIISSSVSCLTAGLCRRAVLVLPPWSGDHLRRNCGSSMDAAQSSRHVKPRVGEKEGASASGISLVRGR